jgi:hypothetical protein
LFEVFLTLFAMIRDTGHQYGHKLPSGENEYTSSLGLVHPNLGLKFGHKRPLGEKQFEFAFQWEWYTAISFRAISR